MTHEVLEMGKKLNLTITAAVLVAMAVIFVCVSDGESQVDGASSVTITKTVANPVEGDTVTFTAVLTEFTATSYKWFNATTEPAEEIPNQTGSTCAVAVAMNFKLRVEASDGTTTIDSSAIEFTITSLEVKIKCGTTDYPSGETIHVKKTPPSTFIAVTNGGASKQYDWTGIDNGTSDRIVPTLTDAGGDLILELTNGTVTRTASVRINVVNVTIEGLANKNIYDGQSITLSPTVTSNEECTYEWKNLSDNSITSSLNITVNPTASTNYQFKATRNGISFTKNVTVTVREFAVNLSVNPASYMSGQNVTLVSEVPASDVGTVTYSWKKNNTAISSVTTSSHSVVAAADSYTVTAKVGTLPSSNSTITLTPTTLAVTIAATPDGASPKAMIGGDSLTLTASAEGLSASAYTVKWTKSTDTTWSKNTATFTEVPIANVTYTATVKLTADETKTATATYSVTFTALTISIASNKTSVEVNGAFTLTATVNKDPIAVAWYKVSGSTETLISGQTGKVLNTTQTQETKYKAKVTNGTVTATSNEVTVAVTGAPTLTITGVTEIDKGATTTLTADYSGTGTVTYSWNNSGGSYCVRQVMMAD